MSNLASYSFLPWVRQGVVNSISTDDRDPAVKLRASIPISVALDITDPSGSVSTVDLEEKTVELYGPGDIVGIQSRAIIKTEPHGWITNFEPNYLPYIDFYEEDFPWKYTPARPTGNQLRPWIMLVVLKEDEFEENPDINDKPTPSFRLKERKSTATIFPYHTELWAWAHVHVNTDLSGDVAPAAANATAINTALADIIEKQPDSAYSRIICPRKLEANTAYTAFLIPVFESGRLSGLNLDLPTDLSATKCGWEDPTNTEFPFYHKWYFRTGDIGDFEYLVNLLQPKPADKSVGVRDIDVAHIGSNLPAIQNTQGVLKLGGALKVPFATLKENEQNEVLEYDRWDDPDPVTGKPHPFVLAMSKRINLTDSYTSDQTVPVANADAQIVVKDAQNRSTGDPDPVVTMPLYGRWHGLQQRLLNERNGNKIPHDKNWIHELNLDPRFRAAAGLGTKVVQKGQEDYMQAAWEQVGNIVEANHKLRMAEVATEVSAKMHTKHLSTLKDERKLSIISPMMKRVQYEGRSLQFHFENSLVPPTLMSGTFRSVTRKRGRVMKKSTFNITATPDNLIQRVNEGTIKISPPKADPKKPITVSGLKDAVTPSDLGWLARLLSKHPWLAYLPFILALIAFFIVALFVRTTAGYSILSAITAIAIALWFFATRIIQTSQDDRKTADAIDFPNQIPAAVDHYPKSTSFSLVPPTAAYTIPSKGNSDNIVSAKFKAAIKDVYKVIQVKQDPPVKKTLPLPEITDHIFKAIDPALTIPMRTMANVKVPSRILDKMKEKFRPVMAYPEIDLPMYRPLADMSSDLFLPNINRIEQNSITLLENNQKFIEAYMTGINHEMSRELLWREYPTDQRGSVFRQFWDVSSALPPAPVPTNIKEQFRDITPIHKWSKTDTTPVSNAVGAPLKNELGQHNQRMLQTGKAALVLVVRGELLKKYPTAVVYAQKADWGPLQGPKTITAERILTSLTDAEQENLPVSKVKTPLFQAKIDPDIYFFGFDLDAKQALGTENPRSTADDPGWFFVLKERPGEPRFGLDIDKAVNAEGEEKIINWNNLSWADIGTHDGECITFNSMTPVNFDPYVEDDDQENVVVTDDIQATWENDTTSAELAYILYQVPVMVAVHAWRMLKSR